MTEQKTLSVSILDRDYRVACPPGQEKQLSDAASTLNEKMKEIRDTGRVFGVERIAVMAALNLTHELLEAKPCNDNDRSAIARLSAKLDAAMPFQDKDASGFNFQDDREF
ncbi:cell division protein ZapA [Reinekea forsetii]|uniref:Cell division protein ZapA n=1 Tax=Reinekea forsetii TaxID=1336806 RepID=A0A2K8KJR5_9GAMM|nr:cell division protein ZapA [Reinekea forsetii]ATX75283.1 cell division Z-ring-associated protein ZapA [Reinekea forsetii]